MISDPISLPDILAWRERYPKARLGSLIRRIEADRQREAINFDLRLSVMAMELGRIVEDQCRQSGKEVA